MTGPAIGEPDPGRAAPPRTGLGNAASGILVLLALGLTFRVIIAYLLPGSGFGVDLQSFRFWANNLADEGLYGFYARDFFHDYTPGYLYVLWLVGTVGNIAGGVGDLIKIPPILADLALGYLVWSMTRELGGSERSARLGAILVLVQPGHLVRQRRLGPGRLGGCRRAPLSPCASCGATVRSGRRCWRPSPRSSSRSWASSSRSSPSW